MKTLIAGAALIAMLAAPATAVAKPSAADRKEARKECRAALDAAGSRSALGDILGVSKGRAFKVCVRQQAADAKSERRQSRRQAVIDCKRERAMSDDEFRAEHGGQTFDERYGQKGRGIGKCVSKQRRANEREADREDAAQTEAMRAAVKRCKDDPATSSGRAFGRCVAGAMADENGQQGLNEADQHGAGGGSDGERGSSAEARGDAPADR